MPRILALPLSAALVAPLVLIGPSPASAAPRAAAPVTSEATLAWSTCAQDDLAEAGFECARLVVPRDRARPAGPTVSLAVTRHRSTGGDSERIGSLFFNPGGPGGSGLSAAPYVWASLPEEVTRRFDLVTWDPRGIGATRPALTGCDTPNPVRPATGRVDWDAVVSRFAATIAKANRECLRRNAGIVDHMGTQEVVADLDRLRAAVGDQRLTFWGMSYGTRIGYVYALTHPDRVRAMLLDGPIDPASTLRSLTEGGVGPDQAYGVFADAYPQADRQFRAVIRRLADRTIPLTDDKRLTRWYVLDLVMGAIGSQPSYPAIAAWIGTVHEAALGSGASARAARERIADGMDSMPPNSNAGGVFAVVNCLDYADRFGVAGSQAAVRAVLPNAPMYGGSLATSYSTLCRGVSVEPDPIPVITGRGPTVPVLVSGSTRDASTVSSWLARMSRAFPGSRTVTYSGGQHVVYRSTGSACIDEPITAYLVGERLPVADIGCSFQPDLTDESAG